MWARQLLLVNRCNIFCTRCARSSCSSRLSNEGREAPLGSAAPYLPCSACRPWTCHPCHLPHHPGHAKSTQKHVPGASLCSFTCPERMIIVHYSPKKRRAPSASSQRGPTAEVECPRHRPRRLAIALPTPGTQDALPYTHMLYIYITK